VGLYAFANCTTLTAFSFESTTPPVLSNITFIEGCTSLTTIYVPNSALATYEANAQWHGVSAYATFIGQ
jgi:hypothetical protein